MPRLTNKEYLERHRALRQIWLDSQKFFGVIPYKQQLDVHLFCTRSRLANEEMIEHRLKVQEFESSSPPASFPWLHKYRSRIPSACE